MQRTRRAILDYLKRKPGATLQELATAGGIAPITARSHLAILLDAGLVQATDRCARGEGVRPGATP